MLRKTFLLLVVLFSTIMVSAKSWNCKYVIEETNDTVFEDSIARISFFFPRFIPGGSEVYVSIRNKTDERIYVEWGSMKINHKDILFNEPRRKPSFDETEVIARDDYLCQDVLHTHTVKESDGTYKEYPWPFFGSKEIREMKAGGSQNIAILLPITYKGKHYDYKFTIVVTVQRK